MKAVLLSLLVACATEPAFDPTKCDVQIYRIDAVELPPTTKVARTESLDLNGDGVTDNQLGQVSGALTQNFAEYALDFEATAATHFATDTDWRIVFASNCPGGVERVAVTAGDEPPGFDLEVERIDGAATARGAIAALPITSLFDGTGTAEPTFVTTVVAQIDRLTRDDDELTGRLTTVAEAVAQRLLFARAMTPFFDDHLLQDSLIATADINGDGTLSESEVWSHPLVDSLLAPDLTIGDVDGLSFGFRVHATRIR
jgi:hypothetical protein